MAMTTVEFRTTVERLAAPAQEQESYLRRLGTAPSADELALEFSDAFVVEREGLYEPVREAALLLDMYLTDISGPQKADLWTVAALYGAMEWARVRQLAGDVLRRMDEHTREG
jgi:hypothetical protein